MASEFQGQFQEAMREAEIDQLKKDMDDMAAKAKDYTQFDPMEDVRTRHREIDRRSAAARSAGHVRPTVADRDAARPRRRRRPHAAAASAGAGDHSCRQNRAPSRRACDHACAGEPEPAIADAKPDAGRAPA